MRSPVTRKSDRLDNMEREEWARTLKKQREMRKQALEVVDELAERNSPSRIRIEQLYPLLSKCVREAA